MVFGTKSGSVKIGDTDMDYVVFGRGEKHLVIIPGLGDGLRTVKGTALPLAFMYRDYGRDYRIHFFSRKNRLEAGYTTREMARDLKQAMSALAIQRAHVMGLSQGGMIAQYLAIDSPEVVDRLVIGVSLAQRNDTIQRVVSGWIALAESGNYGDLFVDSLEKTYAADKVKKYRPFYFVLRRFGRPRSFDRFIIQARSCLGHNAYDELHRIQSPTLVIGDDSDQVVGSTASQEIAERIPGSELYLTRGLGHGAFEYRQFNEQVVKFLQC